ncbi:carbonic anhydrase [Actinoplanes teichomyceticus]|uniref:carbonic anhydrase n=1 Tax=Actinoplanes teichomyceticus TaxID=1867 RepID=A0A561VI94_ACTTI|nr:carbonic anhydrase [Actinoplanes teichomyceticus]TWG11326.1 carbonic anhydrase [Actinoplanes teichomyceticus]GIF16357.1 carbonic anhydrase [Actinoplanes teichomyceticus]
MLEQSLRRRALFAAGGAVAGSIAVAAAASPAAATPTPPTTPHAALRALLDGNRRFVAGHARHPHQTVRRLHDVAAGQHPFAVLLGCADSRVSPELLFDQGIGDLFDDRVAGNIVDDLLLGSMEYAIEEFTPPLVVVLGHERCGAVSATLNAMATGATPPGHIRTVVDALRPIVAPYAGAADGVEQAVRANVKAQVAAVLAGSAMIREKVARGEMAVVGARYDLDTGLVTVLS